MSVKDQRLSRQGEFAWPIPEALIAVIGSMSVFVFPED